MDQLNGAAAHSRAGGSPSSSDTRLLTSLDPVWSLSRVRPALPHAVRRADPAAGMPAREFVNDDTNTLNVLH